MLPSEVRPDSSVLLPFEEYDRILVSFSGGKDSMACVLRLLELGIPREKIELWHQAVDGRPGAAERFFDWPCTEAYCRAIARVLGLPLLFQWREGGFKGEMLKENARTAPIGFEMPDGTVGEAGGAGAPATRMAFPDPVKNLKFRWCSAVLKIDVAALAIRNDPRFAAGAFLFVTGERRQESDGRARYPTVERHRTWSQARRVDHWRPVLDWPEEEVWRIMERWRLNPHPAYWLGWGRLSCISCIFGDANQWASIREYVPGLFDEILGYERQFGRTISISDRLDVGEQAAMGESFVPDDPFVKRLGLSEDYPQELAAVPPWREWRLPPGAFKKTGGPT